MMYKKVLGLFRAVPLEAHTYDWLCKMTDEPVDKIKPVVEQLKKDGHVKGVRKFRLTGEHLAWYRKYCRGNAKTQKV